MNYIEYGSDGPIYFRKNKRQPMNEGKVILQHENGKPFDAVNKLERIGDYYCWIPTQDETQCKILTVHAFAEPTPPEQFLTGGTPKVEYRGV